MDPAIFGSRSPGRLITVADTGGNQGAAFVPDPLAPDIVFSRHLRVALSEADRELSRLEGIAKQIERPDLLFRNYIRREAILSSKIEGTHTTLADFVLLEAAGQLASDGDANEVADYVGAFDYGRVRCNEVGVRRQLLLELHELLMAHSDVAKTHPGRIRDCLVVIGKPPLNSARFVPPPEIFVPELLDDLERYLEEEEEPPLIKIAIAHYQFEAIHPFRDGNGRLGRLLISLWLQQQGVLTSPLLYLSAYFERYRAEYYDSLLRVSADGAWEEWLLFFLRGVATQSRDAIKRTEQLVALRADYHARLTGPRVSQGVHRLIDDLFVIPVLTVPTAARRLDVTYASAKAHAEKLIAAGVLGAPTSLSGTSFYFATELMTILESPLSA